MNTYEITGKKPEQGVESFSWDTITEQIRAYNFIEADKQFKKMHPDYTMVNAPRLLSFSRRALI